MQKSNLSKKYYYENLSLEDIDGEVWVDVLGFDGMYEVSNRGRVKSVSRYDASGHLLKTKILKQSRTKKRQSLDVALHNDGSRKQFSVTTLVGIAFVGEKTNGYEYCHLDKNFLNNDAQNIKLLSVSDSTRISVDLGNFKNTGVKPSQVYEAFLSGKKVATYTRKSIIKKFGKWAYKRILDNANGKLGTQKSYGYDWKTKKIKVNE